MRMVEARAGKQIVCETSPFDAETEVSGFFELTAWIAIDQPDTDFRASVYEIAADGTGLLLTGDAMRARYRRSLREEELIRTREPLRYDFHRFTFVSKLIARGSRLRLVLGPINSIFSEKNYNTGGTVSSESMRDARVVHVRLFHDPEHPSVLRIPLGREE